jgi:hypothetical protein
MIDLSCKDFLSEINTKFTVVEKDFEIELIEVAERTTIPKQEIFSLVFLGAKDNFLEQKIYQMHHEKLGNGELFLVPIAEVANGYKYEAGFNRLIN